MNIAHNQFGTMPDGREVQLFCFTCTGGMQISITNYGGIITSLKIPDKNGKIDEIVAGFPEFKSYLNNHPYFGAIIGRVSNRINKGQFLIDDNKYQLNMNYEHFQLHGGFEGFDKKIWAFKLEAQNDSAMLVLSYLSTDGQEGYPGNLNVIVTYKIFDNNTFEINYEAKTDKPTHFNPTNHTYFNLSGFKENLRNHQLYIAADNFLELNALQIPTGNYCSVENSLLDFTSLRKLSEFEKPQPFHLDHCFVLRKGLEKTEPYLILYHQESGRMMKIFTTQPGIQIYSGNYLDGSLTGHQNISYQKYDAICTETQHFPDTPNQPDFPSTLLKPEQVYFHKTTYSFHII